MPKIDIKKTVSETMKSLAVRKSTLDPDAGNVENKISLAKYIRGASGRGWEDADVDKSLYCTVNKVLTEGTSTAGGFLVAPEYSKDLIGLLEAKSVVRQLGPQILPINSDTINIPRNTDGSTAYWVDEDTATTESDLTFGQLTLVLKGLGALVRTSNFLLADASPAIDALIRNDMMSKIALLEDLAFLFGTGGDQPLGLYNDPDISSVILGDPNGAAPTVDNLYDAMYAIEANNASYNAWVMNPRTKNTLRKLKDANGQYIWQMGDITKGEPDTLLGLPVKMTTQIPITTTCGVNADCSHIFLGDWSEFIIAERANEGLKMAISDEEGDSFAKNLSAIRGVLRVDSGARQPGAFYIINGVRA